MKKYDYDSLTVRNICEFAGVSTGTFYHHFSSKENLLTYYLTEDYKVFEKSYYESRDLNPRNQCDKVIDIYVCCAEYSELKGSAFISGFYSTKNKSLLPPEENKNVRSQSAFTPIFDKTMEYFACGQQEGMIVEQLSPYVLSYDVCMLFNGIVFEWCISEAALNLKQYIRKMLGAYLNNAISTKFIETYGRYPLT